MTRIAVFLDYQNAYHGAREVFGDPSTDPPTMGHVNPLRLGLLLTQLGAEGDPNRELTAVTVYRGRPGAKSHRNLQSAFDRQVTAWQQMPLVTVRSRPLRYQPIAWSQGAPSEWRGQEKGIDVLMAIDIALGARDDRYDVAVIVSADTDLVPAIEVALDAAASSGEKMGAPLALIGGAFMVIMGYPPLAGIMDSASLTGPGL
ncbi:MAG: NYN domain-containing protein [bacterium]|nr:NYN domain-containing protein [bacterium]